MKSITTICILLYVCACHIAEAQEVSVAVSYDTVYMGNVLAVQYSMENWQGDLKQPDFGDFEVVGGPQLSSSMSYSGGQRYSSTSITFYLKPPDTQGDYILPAQKFQGEGKEVMTVEKRIVVKDNPGRIQQNPVIKDTGSAKFDREYQRKVPERGQRQRF